MEYKGKTKIASPSRSQGDGMENTPPFEVDSPKNWNTVHNKVDHYYKHFVPTQGKAKEPKFVPYEPYKAAVSPIIPPRFDKAMYDHRSDQTSSPFVIDSQRVSSLASSIIRMYSDSEGNGELSPPEKTCHSDCGERMKKLEERIGQLEKEKKEMASQYKVQTEVNADLKKMLVASLGEDVQLKVQFMTEDKAALGKEVLRLSEELDNALEEKHRRDVWESKFKASSLLVKELAQWKSTLSQLVNQSATSLEQLTREHENIFEMLSAAHSKLESSLSAADPNPRPVSKGNLPPKTISQLAVEIASLSNKIQERFLGRLFCDTKSKYLRKFTRAENSANQFLKSFDQIGAAGLKGGAIPCQIPVHSCPTDSSANFCRHCSGEVQLL